MSKRFVGHAVFPLAASLFNHSCDPNTSTVMCGLHQVTVATRKIRQGEEMCHIYQVRLNSESSQRP
jgi:hypothetical protein